jgi:glucosamine-6-phosphate deaminase
VRVIIVDQPSEVGRRAARIVSDLVRKKPSSVLGLATGTSPLGLYDELIRMHREEGLDFSQVTTFNLDEYVGLGPTHPHSYRQFMETSLFQKVNLTSTRTHVPDGRALDLLGYGAVYEKQIRDAGGIDLQVLGIGRDGHIAFNEPGSSLGSRTRVKTLKAETIRDNARFFGGEDKVPKIAITMGVGTIMEARRCLLVAMGEAKAEAIQQTIEGPITSQVTASALQLHPDAICIIDEAAATKLTHRSYYDEMEGLQSLLEKKDYKALGIPGDA